MMPKPNQNRQNNVNRNEFQGFSSEKVLHETKPNFWLYSDNFILKIVVLFILVFMFAPIMTFVYTLHQNLVSNFHISIDNIMFYSEIIIMLLIIVVIIKLLLDVLDWNYTRYVFTDARIVVERGFIHKEKIMISYNKIQDIEIRQSLLERIISVGDIIIYGANEYSDTILDDIPSPKKVEEIIITNVNKNSFTNQNMYPNNYPQYNNQYYGTNNNPYQNQQVNNNPYQNQQVNNNPPQYQQEYLNHDNQDDYETITPEHNTENNQYAENYEEVITPERYRNKHNYENNQNYDYNQNISKSKPNKEEVFRKHDQMFKKYKK